MRPADSWRDYELLDATNHNRLERWGQTLLIRPDPQVIWNTAQDKRWKQLNGHYHRSAKGGGSWEFFDLLLEKAHVVGTPGSGFGPSGEGYFRLTAFGSYENTLKAIERIKNI